MRKSLKFANICLLLSILILLSGCSYVRYTDIQNQIETDTVLTREKSPYRLIGDVTVAPGVTLTVEPGVSIQYAGSNWLIVKGRIVAQGTSDLPVDFGRDNLRVHGYRGIRLMANDKMSPSILSNIYLHESDYGIYLDGARAEITFSLISGNGEGIHLWNSNARVEGNQILDNQDVGIYTGGGNPLIRKNILKGNGIALNLDYSSFPVFTGNRIDINHPVFVSASRISGNYDLSANNWGTLDKQVLQSKIQIKEGPSQNLNIRLSP